MKQLTEYKKNGYSFKIVERVGNIARAIGTKDNILNHEVFYVQSHKGRNIHGKETPPSEYPPSNNEWGSKSWTFLSEETARQQFKKLTQEPT